ncbi:hypothetical protein ACFOU2_24570 [Bacillus songklensis]|uniref:SLH domain-containing protein n=1 Tax=Bacillus songklensis TaxID=1069116 RepID=A0ABV8B8K2_9BACI
MTNVELYRPNENFSRAQFASFVYRALAAQRGEIKEVAPAVKGLSYVKAADKVTILFTEPLSTVGTLTLREVVPVTTRSK